MKIIKNGIPALVQPTAQAIFGVKLQPGRAKPGTVLLDRTALYVQLKKALAV